MPIKQKVPVEEKVRIIRKYLSGEISLTEGAKEARVSFESIKSWVNIYENHGVEGFHRNRNNEYTSNAAHDTVEAFAVKDGKFVYVGSAAGAKEYEGADTKVIHAPFAMPGGIEAHGHFISEGAFKLGCYLNTMKDTPDGPAMKMPEDYIEDLKKWRETHPDERGIYAYPYASELLFGEVKLTRQIIIRSS